MLSPVRPSVSHTGVSVTINQSLIEVAYALSIDTNIDDLGLL